MGAERVKTYLRRLPKKDPVPLDKLYPKDKCHADALDLLGKMLKLDPKERISVGEALAHSYLKEYHCIDDEPLCFPPFEFDFEDLPFTKDDLKARILKEIEQFHKDRMLILSPVPCSPKQLQSSQVSSTQSSEKGKDKVASKKGNIPVSSLTLVDVRQKMEQNLKRKKEKEESQSKKSKAARRQSENKETKTDSSTGLSDSDKQMLARWENMRKQTKPFIHPIRKYMKELHELKEEALCDDTKPIAAVPSQPLLPPGNQQQFQFTQFVPQNQNGNVTALKAVKVPSQAVPIVTETLQGSGAVVQTVAGKLVLLAPNQVVSLPPSVLMNVPVPMATPQLVLAPQKSTSQAPVKQILATCVGNQESQGKTASVQNSTIGTSAGLPLGLTTRVAKTTAGVTCDPISSVMGKSVCNGASNKATSTQLVMSLATAVSSTPVQTSTSTAFSMLSQQSFSNFQSHSVPRLVTQLGIPSHVTASKNLVVTAPGPNNQLHNVTNTSMVNMSTPQQGAAVINSVTSSVYLAKDQSLTVSPSPLLNVPHINTTCTNNQGIALSNTSPPFLSTSNNKSQPTQVTLSTQVPQSTSSSVLSTLDNIPWSTASQTFASNNIPLQTQTVQSENAFLHPTSNFNSTSALVSSSFSLTDSVASTAAPLDTSLDFCSVTEDEMAPSLMSPQSLQSMLQSMLSQSDAQLLWNTVLNSPMIQSPIFKLADTSNSTATMTCTATESHPRTSPGSEQFTSQQNCAIAPGTEASQQNNNFIPESVQDAFSDLNVQGVTEHDRLTEEVIFSSMLSSRAKGAGSGYGLGIDIEELLENAGIAQDPALSSLSSLGSPYKDSCLTLPASLPNSPSLSASLLSDWLDGKDMLPTDIDEIQKELESNSVLSLFQEMEDS